MLDLQLYPLGLLGILVLTQIFKIWIKPKYGVLGVQIFIALISFVVAALGITKEWFSAQTIATLVSLWVAANGIYQIIGKYIFDQLGDLLKAASVKK